MPLPLKKGETLLFYYTTKHAATPNLSDLDRCPLAEPFCVEGFGLSVEGLGFR